MFYCENCGWEGKELKPLVDLSHKELAEFEGCPQCNSEDISVLDNPKEEIILQMKRHLRGLEKAIEKLERS